MSFISCQPCPTVKCFCCLDPVVVGLDVVNSQEMFCRMSSTLHKCCWMLSILQKCPNFPLKGCISTKSQPSGWKLLLSLNQQMLSYKLLKDGNTVNTNSTKFHRKSYKLSFQYIFTEDIKDTELQFGIAKHFSRYCLFCCIIINVLKFLCVCRFLWEFQTNFV